MAGVGEGDFGKFYITLLQHKPYLEKASTKRRRVGKNVQKKKKNCPHGFMHDPKNEYNVSFKNVMLRLVS